MTRSRQCKYEQIANDIADLVESGTFRPGDALPSVRETSRQRGVSISTVLQAYYSLEARGLLEARERSGFFVCSPPPTVLPEPEISSPARDPQGVSVRELVMMVLRDTLDPSLIQLGAAHANLALSATNRVNHFLGTEARRLGDRGSLYELPPGCEALRVQIAQRAVAAGCNLAPGDLIITSGCSEAINLCLRAVCNPGDTVAIESPICFDTLHYLQVLGLRALEIPTHPRDGISLDALRFALDHMSVRACIVISNFNNPLGSCIPDENKKDLVALLGSRQIPLIENDIFGEIYFGEHRPLTAKACDRQGLVMLCSSFSKDLAPGHRVGWVAPGRFRADVEWLKYTSSLATPTLPQYALAAFLESGGYEHHLRRIRRTYSRHVASMLYAVQRHFPEGSRVTRPGGGFLLWIQLPEKVDSLDVYKLALRAGIAITPGYIFSATDQYRNFVRLNAANWSEPAEEAITTLGRIITSLAR